jgi:hypothetical protein
MVDIRQPALRARVTWPALATAAYLAVLAAIGLALFIKTEIVLGHRIEFWIVPALCIAVFAIVGGLLRRRRWGYMLAVILLFVLALLSLFVMVKYEVGIGKFVNLIVATYLAVRLIADDDVDTFFARKPGSSS